MYMGKDKWNRTGKLMYLNDFIIGVDTVNLLEQ